jgi:hypothetical protein
MKSRRRNSQGILNERGKGMHIRFVRKIQKQRLLRSLRLREADNIKSYVRVIGFVVWNKIIWLRIWTSRGLWSTRFLKVLWNSWVASQLEVALRTVYTYISSDSCQNSHSQFQLQQNSWPYSTFISDSHVLEDQIHVFISLWALAPLFVASLPGLQWKYSDMPPHCALSQVEVVLKPTVSRPVSLIVWPHLRHMTRFSLLSGTCSLHVVGGDLHDERTGL